MKKSFLLILSLAIPFIGQSQLLAPSALPPGVPGTAGVAQPNTIYSAGSATFYDASGNLILTESSPSWACSPGGAAYVNPAIAANSWYPNYTDYSNYTGTKYAPQCSYTQYLRPFWNCDTIYNETLYLTGNGTTAKLLFYPKGGKTGIISVKSFDGTKTYVEGTDYTFSGRTFTQVGTSMSYKSTPSLKNGLNFIQSSWVCVTYKPDRSNWKFPEYQVKTNYFPKTFAKLQAKQPVVISALGMSITAGLNVSGFAGDAGKCPPCIPYMHSYIDLLGYQLQNHFGGTVTMKNSSCGGKATDWTSSVGDKMVGGDNPDLVIIDMGMNDFWSFTAAQFDTNIKTTISKIQAKVPNAEFILIGGMLQDPTYNDYGMGATSLIKQYQVKLKAMETLPGASLTGVGVVNGVSNIDITTLSDTLHTRKAPKDLHTNELHPNDYMARWYAQALISMFFYTPPPTPSSVEATTVEVSDFMSVMPNPIVDGSFILKLDETVSTKEVQVSVYDVSGKQVSSFKQTVSQKDYQSSDLNMEKGIYIFKAQVDGKVATKKVIVK